MPSKTLATTSFTIRPRGPFSLRESALFGFGQRDAAKWDGVMRMAFCLDDFKTQVGVAARQDADGVHGTVVGSDDVEAVREQVARVLSLADDAAGYLEVGRRDPVVARLLDAAPGLRPPLFYSAYEAAAWAILSQRRPHKQMAELRQRLNEAHGATFEVAGQTVASFPTPEQLLGVSTFPGLPDIKLDRLHAVAHAALEGRLDTNRLRKADPDEAMLELQRIPGIGPFYSALVVIRATGVTDVLPNDEPRVREMVRRLYGLASVPTPAEFAAIAEPWRPWRTWVTVLMRAAGNRVLNPGA